MANFENEKMNHMISDSSIQKLMNLVRRYDRFTCYIDSYKQEQQAIENNKLIAAQFINTLINMGIDITEAEFLNIVNKTGTTDSTITVEDAVMELLDKELSCYDNSHDITSIKAKAIAFYQNKFSGNRHNDTDYWYRVISLNKDYYVDVNLNTSTGKYEAFFTPNVYGEIDFCVNKDIAIYDFENNVEYTLDNNTTKEENKMTTNVKENQTNVKEETKIAFNKVQVGDIIRIAINDCGAGEALVLTKDKDFITIRMEEDTFVPCYDCQSLGCPLMDVHENEIHEIQLVCRHKKDSYHKHDGTLIKPKQEEIEDLENRSKCVIKAVKAAPSVETIAKGEYAFRVLSEDNTFWCDVYPDKVRFAYTRDNDNPMPMPGYGVIINFKEDVSMPKSVNENKTNLKEENKMKTTKTELTKAIEIMESLKASPKTSDDGYIDKKALRSMLEPFEFGFNNKTTRKEMVQCLAAFIKEQQDIADEIAYGNITVEQPQQQPAQQPQQKPQQTEAQQKTDAFIKKLKEAAVANEKKGYGYTVSAFMLQAIVLNVHNGLEKLQGHTITAEEAEKVEKVHEWCIKKGIISQVLYSINEKSFIRAYTDKYDGKKESKDFWYMTVNDALKAGYTIKECTSYKVHVK